MVIVAGGDNNSLQRRFNFYIETRREMEKLRGILQNAIRKLEDISSPPNEKKNSRVNQGSTSSISRAEANWRWTDHIQHLSLKTCFK